MGLELRLLITQRADWLAHEQLAMPTDSRMFRLLIDELNKNGFTVPKNGVHCYCARDKSGETAYGAVTHDPYGSIIRGLNSHQIATVMAKFKDEYKDDWQFNSVFAFLQHIPAQNIIYLYFH